MPETLPRFVGLCLAFSATVAAAAPVDPVYIRSRFGVEGNGARFALGDRCVVVTANHVIADTSELQISPVRSPQDSGVVVRTRPILDVGLALQENPSTRTCAPFPSDQSIRDALFGTQREVWYVTLNSDAKILKVDLIGYSDTELQLQIRPNPAAGPLAANFIPGMSGALVVFDGVPVANLKTLETASPVATATRLDFVKREFADLLDVPQAPRSVDAAKTWEPYAVAQLPKAYQDVVEAARETKRRIERMDNDISRERRKAEDASLVARANEKTAIVKGYAHFDADNGNYYAGQVYSVGIQYGAHGYGVSEVGKGPGVGNRFYCRFARDMGCQGLGVLEYAENPGNTSQFLRWRGLFDDHPKGLGHLSWRTGAEGWITESATEPRPAVWKSPDSRLYEGQWMNGNANGLGVIWDKDGRLIAYGKYVDGVLTPEQGAPAN